MIVGIFGKIASGKSTLAAKKQKEEPEKNWKILDLDEVGHALLQQPDIQQEISQEFPEENILTNGEIDRKKLGELVFSDQEKLQKLEKILHPRIQESIEKAVKQTKKGGVNLLLLSAIPQKMGLEKYCDKVTFLEVLKEEAWNRVRKSRDLSREIFEFIWTHQEIASS